MINLSIIVNIFDIVITISFLLLIFGKIIFNILLHTTPTILLNVLIGLPAALLVFILCRKNHYYLSALLGTWIIMIFSIVCTIFFWKTHSNHVETFIVMLPKPDQMVVWNNYTIYGTIYEQALAAPAENFVKIFSDHFSLLFILFTSSCVFLYLIGPRTPKVHSKLYFAAIILTELLLFCIFSTENLLNTFYILFEVLALPMFFI